MGQVDAIYRRKSVRKYIDEELHVGIIEEIRETAQNVRKLYEDIDLDIHIVEKGSEIQRISTGIIGGYGKIKAPHYIVATSEKKEGYLENAGFALEAIVLRLTDMGVGTCWIGGYVKKQLLGNIIKIKDNHEPVIVISFGYPRNGNIGRQIVKSRKRMEVSEFAFGDMDKSWQYIMDAVRLAPSAVNSQPWRFFKNSGIIDVYSAKNNGLFSRHLQELNRIDVGIALFHLYITALKAGKDIEIKKMPCREKEEYIYITSIIENGEGLL